MQMIWPFNDKGNTPHYPGLIAPLLQLNNKKVGRKSQTTPAVTNAKDIYAPILVKLYNRTVGKCHDKFVGRRSINNRLSVKIKI